MASRYRTEEDAVKDKKVSWREANIAIKENDQTGTLDNPNFFIKRGLTEADYRDLAVSAVKHYAGQLSAEEYMQKLITYTDTSSLGNTAEDGKKEAKSLIKKAIKPVESSVGGYSQRSAEQKPASNVKTLAEKDSSQYNAPIQEKPKATIAVDTEKSETFNQRFLRARKAGEKEFDWKGKDGKVTRIAVKLKEEPKEDKQYYTPEDRKIIYPNLK